MFTNASYSGVIINKLPFHSQMSMGSDEKFCSYYIYVYASDDIYTHTYIYIHVCLQLYAYANVHISIHF